MENKCLYCDREKFGNKDICKIHYQRVYRYGRLENVNKITGLSNRKSPEYYKEYRKLNKENLNKYHAEYIKKTGLDSKFYLYKRRFGGNRDLVLKRDGYKCVKCGTTNKEHIKKWGMSLAVDHIDMKESNTNMSNLQTLCCVCHGKKDAYKSFWWNVGKPHPNPQGRNQYSAYNNLEQ